MSIWKKTMTWLGLDPDVEYEGDGTPGFSDPALGGFDDAASGPVGPMSTTPMPEREQSDFSAVRALGPMTEEGEYAGDRAGSPPLSNTSLRPIDVASRDDPPMGSVTAVPAGSRKPQLVAPRSFNDAQEIADRFRTGAPVLLNLQETDAELGRRLIDFCSGLCYGLRGQMQRVGDRVFLVTPAEVQLTPDDHQLIRDSGLLS